MFWSILFFKLHKTSRIWFHFSSAKKSEAQRGGPLCFTEASRFPRIWNCTSLGAGCPEADNEPRACVARPWRQFSPGTLAERGAALGRRGSREGQTPRKCPVQGSLGRIPGFWSAKQTSGVLWPEPKDLGFDSSPSQPLLKSCVFVWKGWA